MSGKQILEKKLNNRCSKNDLMSRGIIRDQQTDHNVSTQVNQIMKNQTQNIIMEKISSRPSKQHLANVGILDNVQDYDKTQMVKKCISEHLANRPGPMDVYKHLVFGDNNDDSSVTDYPQPHPYQNAKNSLLSKFNTSQNQTTYSNGTKTSQRRTEHARSQYPPKFKNIKFFEFVPGKSGSNGYFVKSGEVDSTKTAASSASGSNGINQHYIQLIEQQAHFLQLELDMKQNISSTNKYSNNWHESNNSSSASNLYEIPELENGQYRSNGDMADKNYSVDLENLQIEFTNSDIDLIDQMRDQHNNSEFIMHSSHVCTSLKLPKIYNNNDASSDVISSGYGTSLHTSDASNFERPYLGFGLSNDCESFNSVYEKIEMFEKLHSKSTNYTRNN